MKWTMGKKIGLILGIPLFFLLLTGVSSYYSMSHLIDTNKRVDRAFRTLDLEASARSSLLELQSEIRGFTATGDEAFFKRFEAARHDWENAYLELKPLVEDEVARSILEKVYITANKNIEFRNKILSVAKEKGHMAGAALLGSLEGQMFMGEFERESKNFRDRQKHLLDESVQATQDASDTTLVVISIGTFLALLLSLITGTLVGKAITSGLRKLTQVAEGTAKGDLTKRIEGIQSQDEVGQLVRSFNTMTDGVRELVKVAFNGATQVAATSQQVSSSAQEMNATAEEVSATVQQISKGTEIQAKKIEETSRVMEKMKKSVEEVAGSAAYAASVSGKTQDSALHGGEETKKAVEKINRIFEVVSLSSNAVQNLGTRSSEIGEIVNIITDISDQTNLLALNAAIEAARAGEAGRGFAVVAEEVRKLAESSAKQADAINKLIKEIQGETQTAVQKMQEGTREVTEGKEIIGKAGNALNDIIDMARQNADQVQKIAKASEEQLVSVEQVAKYMDEISTSAEQTASATQQSSASTEEMTASMEEMATSAQSLADMSMELKDAVSKFKIGEEIHKQDFVPKSRAVFDVHTGARRTPQPMKNVVSMGRVPQAPKVVEHGGSDGKQRRSS